MQTNLHQFLGISEQDSEGSGTNYLVSDSLQQGNHYWTGLKTSAQLS